MDKTMEIDIKNIKERLEHSKSFQYYRDEIGISWDDFEVIDIATNTVIKQGNRDIGLYSIIIDGDRIKTSYDLTANGLTEDDVFIRKSIKANIKNITEL